MYLQLVLLHKELDKNKYKFSWVNSGNLGHWVCGTPKLQCGFFPAMTMSTPQNFYSRVSIDFM